MLRYDAALHLSMGHLKHHLTRHGGYVQAKMCHRNMTYMSETWTSSNIHFFLL